jgi:hypothetical protein
MQVGSIDFIAMVGLGRYRNDIGIHKEKIRFRENISK